MGNYFISNYPKSFFAVVGANCSIFGCSSSRTKSDVTILKVPQGGDVWSSSWRKSIMSVVTKDRVIDEAMRDRIKKNIFVCERHYSEAQLIRYMYKIISSMFLQKSLKVSCNSGSQANQKLTKKLSPFLFSSLEQLCKNVSLNFVKTLTC